MAQQFASDNNAGMCPQAFAALAEANAEGHALGYGGDAWTARAADAIRKLLDADAEVFFVFNGTAANALSLAQLTQPWHAVIAHALSHVETDEAGAPEFFSGGAKLMTADTPLAKLVPEVVRKLATRYEGLHHVSPRVLSLTQATELGTVYTLDELNALTSIARQHDLKIHMDGARLANAVASLGCAPADITWRAGVDVLCLGGVKNGLGIGEAVVFFDKSLAHEFEWRVKQAGQLNSKMRFATAPWCGLLESGAWLANAQHANTMARRLAAALERAKGAQVLYPVEANAVFADIDPGLQARLRAKGWLFYTFLGATGCRLMCAWDTTPETIDRFAADLREATAG